MQYLDLGFVADLIDADGSALPRFLGSTLRGAFGHLLKRTVCQIRNIPCSACPLAPRCIYPRLFEGFAPPDRQRMRRYPQVPQPFVLVVDLPPSAAPPKTTIHWRVRLFGDVSRHWPYVVYVFRLAGEVGLGRQRVRYRLREVRDVIAATVVEGPDCCQCREPQVAPLPTAVELPSRAALRWRFQTPLRLRSNGCLAPRNVQPLDLVIAGRRRYETLNWFYGNREVAPARFFDPDAFHVRERNLRHWGFTRRCGRQDQRMELSGLLGEMIVEGPWAEAGPWLPAISTIHLGKTTSFGFGRVQWELV